MKTWNLYLFKRLSFITSVTLLGIFVLYSLFDISTHLSDFYTKSGLKLKETLTYYSCSIVKEQEIFFSIAFLLASLFTALSLTTSKQIIALQAASIPLRKAYRPVLLLGACISGILLLSQQFASPKAIEWIREFKLGPGKLSKSNLHVCQVGPTRLFFSSYDKDERILKDCIWIFDQSKVLRCKEIEITNKEPLVHFGHLIQWDENEGRYVQESILHSKIVSFQLTDEILSSRPKSPEEMSLTELFGISTQNSKLSSSAKSLLLYRISLCFFPLLLSLIWVPSCSSYSRTFSSIKVILFAILSLIVLFSVWSVLQILGENTLISPWASFSICFLSLSFIAMTQWKKIT